MEKGKGVTGASPVEDWSFTHWTTQPLLVRRPNLLGFSRVRLIQSGSFTIDPQYSSWQTLSFSFGPQFLGAPLSGLKDDHKYKWIPHMARSLMCGVIPRINKRLNHMKKHETPSSG